MLWALSRRANRSGAFVVGTLIQPNIHAALVHFPVALIVLGVLIELLSVMFFRKSTIRPAGRWMIVLGILVAIPTLTTGLFAFRQTVNPAAPNGELWGTIASTSAWNDAHWETMGDHIRYSAIGALMLLVGIVVWIAGTDNARRNMYLLGLVVLITGAGLIAGAGFEGGELVYKHRTGVADNASNVVMPLGSQRVAVTSPVAIPEVPEGFSSLEIHLLLAGCAIAMVAIAIALSVRLSNVTWENRFAEEKAVAAGYRPAGRMGQGANLLSIPVIYPGAFWILALLLLLATAGMGLSLFGIWRPGDLASMIRQKQQGDEWRPVLHAYFGLAIIGLSAILGLMMKVWPRRRLIMGMLCTLIILAIAGQAWSGILMLYDGHAGSVMRFNRTQANKPISFIPFVPLHPATRSAEAPLPAPATAHTLQSPGPTTTPNSVHPID